MEGFTTRVRQAKLYFRTADHLTYVTYPLVRDTKLLLTIIHNLNRAAQKSMDAVLYYERLFKRIMNIPDDFELKFSLFKEKAKRYGVNESTLRVIKELHYLMRVHKESPMEFTRNNKLVICGDNGYRNLKMVGIDNVKNFVIAVRPLIEVLERVKNA